MSKRTKNSRKDIALQRINDRITETKADSSLLSFNYKYFLFGEDYGESFQEWEKEKILADLNEKLKVFSAKTAVELEQDGTLERFDSFPSDSEFSEPPALKEKTNITWARLRITGGRRLIGFLMKAQGELLGKEVFYIVFLDKNHRFAPYTKKGT